MWSPARYRVNDLERPHQVAPDLSGTRILVSAQLRSYSILYHDISSSEITSPALKGDSPVIGGDTEAEDGLLPFQRHIPSR